MLPVKISMAKTISLLFYWSWFNVGAFQIVRDCNVLNISIPIGYMLVVPRLRGIFKMYF